MSGPVAGRFGSVLVRVTEVQPESGAALRGGRGRREAQEIAQERASERIEDVARRDRGPARRRPAAGGHRQGEGPDALQVPAVDAAAATRPASRSRPARARGTAEAALRLRYRRRQRGPAHPQRRLRLVRRDRHRAGPRADPRRGADEVERQWRDDEIAQRLSEKARRWSSASTRARRSRPWRRKPAPRSRPPTTSRAATAKDDLADDAVDRIFARRSARPAARRTDGRPRRVQGHGRDRAAARHHDPGGRADRGRSSATASATT